MRALLGIVLVSACGGPSAPPPATHDDFRAIQRHEATIAAARARAEDERTECGPAGEAVAEVRGAAESICRIAEDTADLDATARCDRARREQRAVESVVRARCELASISDARLTRRSG